ncbi:hypothetical protein [Marinomonas algicola]|uniref:hypothetical protein n=1 Tax=Marinomonas algicola TaxID=2773454 RepID=UPI001748F1CB|nr:hypothetical protein [Marinomonas algicola]
MVEKVLVSWIGETDLNSAISDSPLSAPISSTLSTLSFDRVVLLCCYPKARPNKRCCRLFA